MIRNILLFILIVLVYYAAKTILRSAVRGYSADTGARQVKGEEMILDPECRTYLPKSRAVARRIKGGEVYFCSKACADSYESRMRK